MSQLALLVTLWAAVTLALPLTPMDLVAANSTPEGSLSDVIGDGPTREVRLFVNGRAEVVPQEALMPLLDQTSMMGASNLPEDVLSRLCGLTFVCNKDEGFGAHDAPNFCDDSSGWIVYNPLETVGGGGSAILKAIDHGPSEVVGCFGVPLRNWDLEMSVIPVASGMLPGLDHGYDGCYASVWENNPERYCPNSFTPLDTFGVFNATGPGILLQVEGNPYWVDYFMGYGARVSYRPLP